MRLVTIIILFMLLGAPFLAQAGVLTDPLKDVQPESGYGQATETSISQFTGKIINAFLGLLGTIFLVLIVYGGYLWMTAGGDEEQVKKAKSLINQAVIGLIVVLSAVAITVFVVDALSQATK